MGQSVNRFPPLSATYQETDRQEEGNRERLFEGERERLLEGDVERPLAGDRESGRESGRQRRGHAPERGWGAGVGVQVYRCTPALRGTTPRKVASRAWTRARERELQDQVGAVGEQVSPSHLNRSNFAPEPGTRHTQPGTQKPEPETRNPEPETRNPKLGTRNPKPRTRKQAPKLEGLQDRVGSVREQVSPSQLNPKPETRNSKLAPRQPGDCLRSAVERIWHMRTVEYDRFIKSQLA